MTTRKIAVVSVAYGCVPTKRVDDHLAWNADYYALPTVHGYLVTDTMHDVPDDIKLTQCLFPPNDLPIGPGGKRLFSLTKTKNFGIRCAINDGADVVICTDIDIAFSPTAFDAMSEVQTGQAIMPVYHRCFDYANRHAEAAWVDYGMTGTTAMTPADWRRVQYDERCVAYGGDDGIILRSIEDAGIELIPYYREHPAAPIVWHVEHTPAATANVPGSGRSDCWGRAEGFNPDNFAYNRQFHKRRQ